MAKSLDEEFHLFQQALSGGAPSHPPRPPVVSTPLAQAPPARQGPVAVASAAPIIKPVLSGPPPPVTLVSYPFTHNVLQGTALPQIPITQTMTAASMMSKSDHHSAAMSGIGKIKHGGKAPIRYAAGKTWADRSLDEWPDDDFRLFAGDIGNDCTETLLREAFSKYPSFSKCKLVRNKDGKNRGYGFLSFLDPNDYLRAFKEMNGKYVGSRPLKLRKSTWKERNFDYSLAPEQKKRRQRVGY